MCRGTGTRLLGMIVMLMLIPSGRILMVHQLLGVLGHELASVLHAGSCRSVAT